MRSLVTHQPGLQISTWFIGAQLHGRFVLVIVASKDHDSKRLKPLGVEYGTNLEIILGIRLH